MKLFIVFRIGLRQHFLKFNEFLSRIFERIYRGRRESRGRNAKARVPWGIVCGMACIRNAIPAAREAGGLQTSSSGGVNSKALGLTTPLAIISFLQSLRFQAVT